MATIKDVAKLAGVSVATVSKVYNNYSEIPQTTKDKVFQAAKSLDYIPNKNAVMLSKKDKYYIGLIVSNLYYSCSTDEYLFKILSGVNMGVEERDYELLIFTTENIKKTGMTYVQFCQYHNLIGAIIHGLRVDDPMLKELSNSSIPCVLIDIHLNGMNTATITVDNHKASQDIFELLYNNGHRHFCHILGPTTAEVANVRKDGFLASAESHMVPLENLALIDGDFNVQTSYEHTKQLLKSTSSITAFFASSDLMALGTLKALHEHDLQVGKDVTLIGFDGLSTLEYTSPAIGTVSQNFIEMGKKSVEVLEKIFHKRPYEKITYVPYKILPRESLTFVRT